MRLVASAIMTLAFACIGSQSQAQALKVDYQVTLAGLTLGTADLSSTFEGSKYKMQAVVKLSGLARMLTGGKGAATASGAIVGPQPQPAAFAVTSRSSSDQRTVRMGLTAGNVSAVEIVPPIDEKPDRVPIREDDKRGVVDPVSALLMPPVASGSLTDAANCNRTIPIFDGAARFNVVLSYAETKNADVPGYSGPVLVCNARYVPISGHRSLRPSTKFMEENRDMSVWLAPIEGQRMLFPVRVAVRTMIGMSVVEASRWTIERDAKVLPISAKP
jgi:hypothetical protein